MFSDDFANDNLDKYSGFVNFHEIIENEEKEKADLTKPKKLTKQKIMIRVMTQDVPNNNPLALIHELRPDCIWEFIGTEAQGRVATSFQMKLQVGDKQYIGEGKTKKLAKYAAAREALHELFGINCANSCPEPNKAVVIDTDENLLLDQKVADMIGFEVLNASKIILEPLDGFKKWNVLSSIVLTSDYDPNWIDILCITTGTKCIKGDRLSMTGSTIHDSHAEVLSRRCFISYLYSQLSSIIDNNYQDRPEFILKFRDDGYGFCLKPGIRVNLFISTAPCGDARVFSPNQESEGDPHVNRLSRGLLRAKIEAGEGTIPVKRGSCTLTWDGVLLGEQRLQFMSCSDKIAIWNIVGLQGSLLSHFIEPIYLNSLVLGSLFNYTHLVRAVHGRLNHNFDSESLKKLPNPYKVNSHKVARSKSNVNEFVRQVTRSPNYAINWIKGDPYPEIIACDTGKIFQNEEQPSRLSKKTFFQSFRTLLGRNAPKLPTSPLGLQIPTIYRDAKTSASTYLQARHFGIQAFNEQNLGDWIQVPAEVDLFGY